MNWVIRTLCLLCLLHSVVACRAESYDVLADIEEQEALRQKKEINVLLLGNSLSRDAFGYVPGIIESLCKDVDIHIYNLQIGGVALNTHLKTLKENKPAFEMDYYLSINDKWLTVKRYQASKKIFDRKWDVVILQQGTGRCWKYEETLSDVKGLRDYLDKVTTFDKFAFMINPSQPEGSSALNGETMEERFGKITEVAKRLLEEGVVTHLVPCGTALQNARLTSLDSIGDFGHLSYDGRHLQDGIPCAIEGYVGAQTLLDLMDLPMRIEDSNWRVSQLWVDVKHIPGKHGNVIEGTAEDYALCLKCARSALDNPLALTPVMQDVTYPPCEVYDMVHAILLQYGIEMINE